MFRHEDHSVNIAQPKEKLKRCDDHVGSFGIFQLLKRNTPEDSPVEFVFFYGDRGLHWQGPSLAHFEGLSHHSKTFQDIPKNTSIFDFFWIVSNDLDCFGMILPQKFEKMKTFEKIENGTK